MISKVTQLKDSILGKYRSKIRERAITQAKARIALSSKRLEDFTAIFSIPCDNDRHINRREADAVVHYLKWLLRSRGRHRKRASSC